MASIGVSLCATDTSSGRLYIGLLTAHDWGLVLPVLRPGTKVGVGWDAESARVLAAAAGRPYHEASWKDKQELWDMGHGTFTHLQPCHE
jgi:hypothetical protein